MIVIKWICELLDFSQTNNNNNVNCRWQKKGKFKSWNWITYVYKKQKQNKRLKRSVLNVRRSSSQQALSDEINNGQTELTTKIRPQCFNWRNINLTIINLLETMMTIFDGILKTQLLFWICLVFSQTSWVKLASNWSSKTSLERTSNWASKRLLVKQSTEKGRTLEIC